MLQPSVVAACIVLLMLAIVQPPLTFAQGGPPPTRVAVDVVRLETLQDRRQVTGSLRPIARTEVASLEAGRVVAVHVREADLIEAGQLLAELDDRRIRAQLAEVDAEGDIQRATIRQREAQLRRAQREYDRLKTLQGSAAATVQELEDAESALDVAQAQLDAAQRQADQIDRRLDLLRVRLDDMQIAAPFSGRIVAHHVEVGEWIDPGDPVVTLIADDRVEAWLDVPERYKIDIRGVVDAIDVEVLAANEVVRSEETRVVPQLDPRIRNFVVIAELGNEEGHFASGMSVIAWVPVGVEAVFRSIPKTAVLRTSSGWSVIVARPQPDQSGGSGHVAAIVPVERAFETPDRFIIAGGNLEEGDFVVTEGNERLNPGQPLIIMPPTATDTSSTMMVEARGHAVDRMGEIAHGTR